MMAAMVRLLDVVQMKPALLAITGPALTSTYVMGALLWLSLIAFAVLGGADFGAGVWDLFAFGQAAEKERGALVRAIGPIWEANEIWLIFLITGLFTGFPLVFSTLSIALFFPGMLALLGLVLRGAAFIYYSHFRANLPVNVVWGRMFSIFSMIAPFCFGLMAGAVASGRIHVKDGQIVTDFFSTWLTPFSFACGAFALAMCAVLAATYMVVEAQNVGDSTLIALFRKRALLAYAATAVLGAIGIILSLGHAHYLWTNLTSRALILVIGAALLGIAAATLLWLGYFRLARVAIAGMVVGIFLAWGIAQYPYLVPPDLTVTNTASPPSVMGPLLISTIIGMALLLPSLWFMLYLFKARNRPQPHPSTSHFIEELPPAPEPVNVSEPTKPPLLPAELRQRLLLFVLAALLAMAAVFGLCLTLAYRSFMHGIRQ